MLAPLGTFGLHIIVIIFVGLIMNWIIGIILFEHKKACWFHDTLHLIANL